MGRIIAQILKALRSVFSRFGLASAASLAPDKDQPGIRQSVLPSNDEGNRDRLRHQPIEGGSAHELQGSQVGGSVKAIQVGSVAEGETDSESVGTETPDAAVQQKQPMQDAAAAGCGASSEGDGGERVVSVTPDHVADDAMERDPTHHTLQMGVVDSSAEEPPRNDEMTDAPVERDIAGSTIGARCSSPHDETAHEASAPRTVPDGGMSNGSEDEDDSARPEDAGAGDSGVDHKSVQEDTLQIDEATPRSDPRPPLDVQNEPISAIASSNAGEWTRADTDADTSSTSQAGLSNEELCGREALPEGPKTASVGVGTSDSGCVNLPLSEEERQKPTEEAWATADDCKVLSPRQPIPPEDAHEYPVDVQDVSAVDREYARWNNAIVEQLLLAGPSSEEALLCVNPRILAKVFEEAGLGLITPEEAEQQFTTAVANIYQRRVLRHKARLRVLRRCGGGGPPDCVAFLAGSVLAAFRMQSDEELSGNAYYRRLAVLLKCEMQGAHPIEFDPPVFESLWVFLHNWLFDSHGRQLAMPKRDVGFRRFVALSLAHVPLRSLDIEKLPVFFSWAGYGPKDRVRHDRLLADLKRWQQSRNMLTPTGAGALYDDRSSAVSAQASAELESWDGSFCESPMRRSALVEIQFDVVQRNPLFSYLPRRPPGFPRIFDGGERVFEASDEGWYDPAQIRPEDGELLENGFEWPLHANGVHFTLRRSGAVVIPLTPSSSCSGFISSRRLLRGVRCSVLCRDGVLPTVKEYLSEVAQSSLNPVSHPLLPNGWSMFKDLSARVHVDAPTGLEALEVDPNVEVIVAGGLRIGRRWSWLAGAPPRILVSGMEAQDHIKVNGTSVEVGASGELLTGEVFSQPGEYLVEAGCVRRKIEIARPQMSAMEKPNRIAPLDSRNLRIALPQGSWTLIGYSPDQVCYSRAEFFRGTIASCPFQPSWAVHVGAGPGAVVAATSYPSPPRSVDLQRLTGKNRKLVERWISSIYEAHIRRPRFIGLNGFVPDDGIVDVWRQYTILAKEIKMKLKRPR